MSLTALLPGGSVGTVALIAGILELSTTIGLTVRGTRGGQGHRHTWDLFAVACVGAAYLAQLVDSPYLLTAASRPGALDTQAILVIVFFLIAIERAWQIIGGDSCSASSRNSLSRLRTRWRAPLLAPEFRGSPAR